MDLSQVLLYANHLPQDVLAVREAYIKDLEGVAQALGRNTHVVELEDLSRVSESFLPGEHLLEAHGDDALSVLPQTLPGLDPSNAAGLSHQVVSSVTRARK